MDDRPAPGSGHPRADGAPASFTDATGRALEVDKTREQRPDEQSGHMPFLGAQPDTGHDQPAQPAAWQSPKGSGAPAGAPPTRT